jgi:cytochrome b561
MQRIDRSKIPSPIDRIHQVPQQSTESYWRYSPPAVVLHWLIALFIFTLFVLGWCMMTIEHRPGGADWWFNLHRSLGLTVAGFVVLRILWRVSHRPAELSANMPAWEKILARAAHWMLYALMIVMPLTGYLGSSFNRSGAAFFGYQLPFWSAPDRDLSRLFFSIHASLVWLFVGVIALHALAGLKHWLIDKDKVLQRMWF